MGMGIVEALVFAVLGSFYTTSGHVERRVVIVEKAVQEAKPELKPAAEEVVGLIDVDLPPEKIGRAVAVALNEILKNQKKQEKELAELRREIKKLRGAKVAVARPAVNEHELRRREQEESIKEGLAKLGEIKNDWTDKQVEQYLKVIYDVVKDVNSFSSGDYATTAIKALGGKRLPQIIKFLQKPDINQHKIYHFRYALPQMISDDNKEDKKLVIDNLDKMNFLASIVRRMGWQKDAKDKLVEIVKGRKNDYADWECIQALSELQDKETYPVLIEYFINGGNKFGMYNLIKELPGIEIEKHMAKAWDKARSHEKTSLAPAAAEYGIYDAFEELIVQSDNNRNEWQQQQCMSALRKLTGKITTPKAYAEWYNKNREQIFFDPKTKKYILDPKRKPRGGVEVF